MCRRPLRFIVALFAVLAVTGGGLAAFNYVVDPLQYYRVATLYRPVFWEGMQRFQIPGLARNYARDIVVIGSSVTENFLIADIEHTWHKSAMRLSISGSVGHEQFLALRLGLMTGKVTDVIWGFDLGAFYGQADRVREDGAAFPHYLYRTLPLPNPEYLLSLSTTRLSYMALRGFGATDLDRYHVWYDKFEFSRKATVLGWQAAVNGSCAQFKEPPFELREIAKSNDVYREMEENLEQNVVALVKAYPRVTFHLFLPPMARVGYFPRRPIFAALLPFREAVVRKAAPFPNARVYDFQAVDELADDLARYKDAIHFNLKTTNDIIVAIRDGKYRLTADNLGQANNHLIEKANAYDLCPDGRMPELQ